MSVVLNGEKCPGKTVEAIIPRLADLLGEVYLVVYGNPALTEDYAPNCDNAFAIIDTVEIYIGDILVDRQTGEWLHIWAKLAFEHSKYSMLLHQMMNPSEDKLYIPLQFWFCRNPGLYIPLIALENYEVKIRIKFSDSTSVFSLQNDQCDQESIYLLCNYVYLDTPERRALACADQEYLIEQVQMNEQEYPLQCTNVNFPMVFSFPVKELVWVIKDNSECCKNPFSYKMMDRGNIKMNGMDRIPVRDAKFFSMVERYEHHSGGVMLCEWCDGTPLLNQSFNTTSDVYNFTNNYGCIYLYSFAISPEDHQPSGTCNFSRIKNPELNLEIEQSYCKIRVYATNYNLLTIKDGMAGVKYSN